MTPDGPMTHEVAWKPIDSFGDDGETSTPRNFWP